MRIAYLLIGSLLAVPALAQEDCGVSYSVVAISCGGANDGELTVTGGGGANLTYLWDHAPGLNAPTATGLGPGIYNVLVTGDDGCETFLTETLVEPDVVIDGILTYCPSAPPVLTATPVGGFNPIDYLWTSNDIGPVVQVVPGTTGAFTVTATDANGCAATDQVNLVELTPPFAVPVMVDSACQNLAFLVNTLATNGDSLVWRWSGGGFSNARDPLIAFANSGWQYVTLQAFDLDGCGNIPVLDSIYIRPQVPAIFTARQIPCRPIVEITLGSTADSCAFFIGDSLVTHDCAAYFQWDHRLYREYTYTLFATQANNCNDTLQALVDVRTEPTLFLANTFTPNEDGINDRWPTRVDVPELGYELRLYNRWGESIWSTTNPQEQWDGAGVPMGVYIYTMKMRDPCSPTNEIVKRGHLTIFR